MAFPLYLLSESSYSIYLLTQELQKKAAYFFTSEYKTNYIFSEDLKYIGKYIFTPKFISKYIFTEELNFYSKYIFTSDFNGKYIFTPNSDILDFDNECYYPKKLDVLRQKATLLIWKEVKAKLYDSLDAETWGKINTCGYNASGSLRLLLDYLSSIWLERDNDSRAGLVRTSDYYYTKYKINDIIVNFRECDINIKSIVALFDLNSYSVIDGNWPNYFIINNILNPPTEETLKTLKQYTDIFTLDGDIGADSGQSLHSLNDAQTNFPLTKTLKYLTSFVINGSDYIGYVDYNTTGVTYVPSVFGYTITNSDTVTITYWYEE